MASTTHALVSQCMPSVHLQRPRKQNCSVARVSRNCLVATRKIRSALSSASQERRRCQCLDFHKELVPYQDAWLLQKHLVEQRHILVNKDDDQSDMVIILQHQPVYTLGTNGTEDYLKFDTKDAPLDVFRTERGGEVTYHGPGQIVMYPILNLRYHRMDLHWYLRSLEEIVIRVLSSAFTIKGPTRLEGLTGVWVGNEKLAAIGIRVTRWITYHGLALNVNVDLSPFQHIVPCGIRDRQVGSISKILGILPGEADSGMDLIDVAHDALLKEFSEVFQLSLQSSSVSEYEIKRLSLISNQLKNDKEIMPCPLRLY